VLQLFDIRQCFGTYRGLYEELGKGEFDTIDLRGLDEAEVAEPVEVVPSYRPAAFEGSSLRVGRLRSFRPGVLG
jgi:hypothetical protein